MKTVCDFCKTEYSLESFPKGAVKCAVCGNVWTVVKPIRKNAFLTFIAALCALLAAIVFAVVAVTKHQINVIEKEPLVAEIQEINTINDENGRERFVVSGIVRNRSEHIYGAPNLIINTYDENGKIIDRQKFLPPATLLDSGSVVNFGHILSVPTQNVKKISVELEN